MRFVQPEIVVTQFHLREGDKVADFGCGIGYFTKHLSKAVGSEGRVYAFEIQKNLLEAVVNLARKERLNNIETILCDLEAPQGTKLREETLDAGLLVNTLFQIENKDAAFEEIARVMRKGGKLFVIDWTSSFGGLGPAPGQIITEENVRELAEKHGFSFERSFPTGEHHYGIALRKV